MPRAQTVLDVPGLDAAQAADPLLRRVPAPRRHRPLARADGELRCFGIRLRAALADEPPFFEE